MQNIPITIFLFLFLFVTKKKKYYSASLVKESPSSFQQIMQLHTASQISNNVTMRQVKMKVRVHLLGSQFHLVLPSKIKNPLNHHHHHQQQRCDHASFAANATGLDRLVKSLPEKTENVVFQIEDMRQSREREKKKMVDAIA